jgi:(p)ppGpp synthase/HD superfamily hydrolase
LIEDSEITYDYLVEHFGKRIADLVNEVTHSGCKDTKGYYFPRLKTREGILIKYCDHVSNLNRITEWDEKRQEHFIRHSKFWRTE